MRPLTPFELARQQAVEAGYATVANRHTDPSLIVWAKRQRHFLYIGRGVRGQPASPWKNPYRVGRDGTLDQVLARYAADLDANTALLARLPELAGMVLVCWCAPQPCHGEELLRRLGLDHWER